MADPWSAAVLTGGRSTRMGRDKASLAVDGVPMAQRVVRALEDAGAGAIACIGGAPDRLEAIGLAVVPDDHPGEGPLGGAITGLAWSRAAITLVVPCDLVEPRPAAFGALVTALSTSDADVAVPILDGAWRALPAAFRASCAPTLSAVFGTGERSLHRAIAALARVAVDTGPLPDADTPEELRGAGRVVES
jgi:molybdopterin-guanine dinucleotide biosynthesis protein A